MRVLILATASLLTSTALVGAQNEFMIYPERNGSSATYTSRTGIGLVEQFMEAPGNLFSGIGDAGAGCQVTGVYHWATDEDASTMESFRIVLRTASPAGGPDTSAAGVITQVGPFNLPTGVGRLGWRIGVTFATPVTVPCMASFFYGIELAAAPNWPGPPGDGHSIWDARYSPPPTRLLGDNPRVGAPNHAWGNNNGFASSNPWTWRIGITVNNPVLNVGGIDPLNARQSPVGSSNYGAGGLYPDISGLPRSDGIDLRTELLSAASGTVLGLLSATRPAFAAPVPGIAGNLYLHPGFPIFTLGTANIFGGVATLPVATPGTVPVALMGSTLYFQTLTVDAAFALAWSNVAGVSF
jgi:hypothetical protein